MNAKFPFVCHIVSDTVPNKYWSSCVWKRERKGDQHSTSVGCFKHKIKTISSDIVKAINYEKLKNVCSVSSMVIPLKQELFTQAHLEAMLQDWVGL